MMNLPGPDSKGDTLSAAGSAGSSGHGSPASAAPLDRSSEGPVVSSLTLESPVGPPLVIPELAGSEIGPFKLLKPIGEGGMGVVYMAEQTTPIRRRVDVKIIKPGTGSSQVIARFEAERQALAILDHPNIAKVLDAGATATGRPYFVMELVDGEAITDYCDQAPAHPARERIDLFIAVCQAVQHAHQQGIIHRDLKPSNVLVTLYDGRPVPKVIDFGLAKAIDSGSGGLTERTLFTRHGAILGTLEYMSPEQAENAALDVDTRTDIYALGVMLYELLTGTTPLERLRADSVGYSEILRRIREEEPPRLESRLSKSDHLDELASSRGVEPAKLTKLVRGELDWIARRKSLEKDRSRRYATANDLARDLERYLAGEPVEAGPPSAGYRLRKFAGRHRAALATATAFLAVLLGATVVSTIMAVRATRSEAESDATFRFFRDHVLAVARPEDRAKGRGGDITLREAIDLAEPSIASEFEGQPRVEAAVRDTLGTSYYFFGEVEPAIRQLERAVDLRSQSLGATHPDTLDSMDTLALAFQDATRFNEAIALHERAFAASKRLFGLGHRNTLRVESNLATAYGLAGRAAEAVPPAEHVLAVQMAKLGPDNPDTLTAVNNLAIAYRNVRRNDESSLTRSGWTSCRDRERSSGRNTLTR